MISISSLTFTIGFFSESFSPYGKITIIHWNETWLKTVILLLKLHLITGLVFKRQASLCIWITTPSTPPPPSSLPFQGHSIIDGIGKFDKRQMLRWGRRRHWEIGDADVFHDVTQM